MNPYEICRQKTGRCIHTFNITKKYTSINADEKTGLNEGSELRSRKWGEGRMCLSLTSVSVDCDICVPMLNYSWEGWINDSSSLPVHIHFKASSETHTREAKAGRLTG